MTTADLHKILDDENRKLSLDELKRVIYDLKQVCFNGSIKQLAEYEMGNKTEEKHLTRATYYDGEKNAFQICLDLLEHLGEKKNADD